MTSENESELEQKYFLNIREYDPNRKRYRARLEDYDLAVEGGERYGRFILTESEIMEVCPFYDLDNKSQRGVKVQCDIEELIELSCRTIGKIKEIDPNSVKIKIVPRAETLVAPALQNGKEDK
ncbi:MAG: hypothetical protein Q7S74_04840 [Nanoarchaeota archaeon]|nr:hypothetical protein [Nanoarchaeota archaeon]